MSIQLYKVETAPNIKSSFVPLENNKPKLLAVILSEFKKSGYSTNTTLLRSKEIFTYAIKKGHHKFVLIFNKKESSFYICCFEKIDRGSFEGEAWINLKRSTLKEKNIINSYINRVLQKLNLKVHKSPFPADLKLYQYKVLDPEDEII